MNHKAIFTCFFLLLLFSLPTDAQHADSVTIVDSRHYSNVFGEIRNYRIFLPPGYFDKPQKKYPVIYFLHGWSQRYFGDGGQKFENLIKALTTREIILRISFLPTR